MKEYEIYMIPIPTNSDFREKCINLIDELPKEITVYGIGIGQTTEEEMALFLQDIVNTAAENRKWKKTII